MDFLSIAKLLPEFLNMLKGSGGESGALGEMFRTDAGIADFFEKSGKYTKYLPLLPLISKLGRQGVKGLLSSSGDVAVILDVISQSENRYAKMLRGLDGETVAKILPLFAEFFEKKQSRTVIPMPAEFKTAEKKANPLACIAEIADKDVLYALNLHISRSGQ